MEMLLPSTLSIGGDGIPPPPRGAAYEVIFLAWWSYSINNVS